MKLKITIVGAGSREFGPATVADVLLSDPICERDLALTLMDLDASSVERTRTYAQACAEALDREVRVDATTALEDALRDTDYV
ncbi:MAG: hypothetical protein P8Y21_14515, partial [Gemmatimonadales bacterium]